MEWWLVLLIMFGSFIVLMASGMPVAFAFMLVSFVGVYIYWGPEAGLTQLGQSIFTSVATFAFLPAPLFVLMGEIMFLAGIAPRMIDALDMWLGRLPGRLGLLAVSSGALLSTLSGDSLATTGVLGSVLVPEMEKRGYKKVMSLGPILGSGGLAMMIPPSFYAVFIGVIAEVSIGRLLIAIIVPGLMMATFYSIYIITRCRIQPSLAPSYEVPSIPLSVKLFATAKYVLPLGLIVFLVTGVIFLGIASPSEAAATGVLGCFLLAVAYRRFDWEVVKESVTKTLAVTVMVFMIVIGARAFGQILAWSGASRGLVDFATGLPLPPIAIVIVIMFILLIMGMFMVPSAIILITTPLLMPVIISLGFDPIWFVVLFLVNTEMAVTTPPFGLNLFIMKGVATSDTTLGDCIRAAMPFLICDLVVLGLMIAFPSLVLWLPGIMF